MALLGVYRALLSVYRALLRVIRALLIVILYTTGSLVTPEAAEVARKMASEGGLLGERAREEGTERDSARESGGESG